MDKEICINKLKNKKIQRLSISTIDNKGFKVVTNVKKCNLQPYFYLSQYCKYKNLAG